MSVNKKEILDNISFTDLIYDIINKKLNSKFSRQEVEKMLIDVINDTQKSSFLEIDDNIYITNLKNKMKITINAKTYKVVAIDILTTI